MTPNRIDPEEVVDLEGQSPIAKGTYRDVYIYPDRPEVVLKVLRPGAAIRPSRPIRNYLKSRSIQQRYRFMFREYETYLEAKLKVEQDGGELPLSDLLWLQKTSRGVGMVAERIRQKNGEPARSLGTLHRNGHVDGEMLKALNNFIKRLNELDIIANDTNPENVLLDETKNIPRFVLVDGFGDPSPVPLKRLSHKLRQRARDRRCIRMSKFLGCAWSTEKRELAAF